MLIGMLCLIADELWPCDRSLKLQEHVHMWPWSGALKASDCAWPPHTVVLPVRGHPSSFLFSQKENSHQFVLSLLYELNSACATITITCDIFLQRRRDTCTVISCAWFWLAFCLDTEKTSFTKKRLLGNLFCVLYWVAVKHNKLHISSDVFLFQSCRLQTDSLPNRFI